MTCAEEKLKEYCQRLAEGIMRNGLITGQLPRLLEAFEAFQGEYGSQRIAHFWFHEVIGFFVTPIDDEMAHMQVKLLQTQLEFYKIMIDHYREGDGWKGKIPDGI